MKKIRNYKRAAQLMEDIIDKLHLNLSGMTVLTEVASGNFVVTPMIALKAGADQVYVVCRDSNYGKIDEILEYMREFAEHIGLDLSRITYVEDKKTIAHQVNIVTNLGFVRPIDREFIERLPYDSAIPLMFESWEFRESDMDIHACKMHHIPVLGTDESVQALQIFRYVAMCILKLLFEADIEIFKSKILLLSSGGYLEEARDLLQKNGVELLVYDTLHPNVNRETLREFVSKCDAIVVAEQENDEVLIDSDGKHIDAEWLLDSNPVLIHIAGCMNYAILDQYGIRKHPDKRVDYGYMTVTTDYVGIRPVIELHAGGLKVGQALVDGLRKYHDYDKAVRYALGNSPAMEFHD